METEQGYLELANHKCLEIFDQELKINQAAEPTNIIWEGSNTKNKNSAQLIKMFLSITFMISAIFVINYAGSAET